MTTSSPGRPRHAAGRAARTAAALAALVTVGLAGCGGPAAQPSDSPSPAPSSTAPTSTPTVTPSTPTMPSTPSKPVTSPSTQEPVEDQVRIAVTIKGDQVDPNGKKIDVPLGATVVLTVASDANDEIHAHVGNEDGYSLEVRAGEAATGRFRLESPGSFEVESHELHKTIVILNVR